MTPSEVQGFYSWY